MHTIKQILSKCKNCVRKEHMSLVCRTCACKICNKKTLTFYCISKNQTNLSRHIALIYFTTIELFYKLFHKLFYKLFTKLFIKLFTELFYKLFTNYFTNCFTNYFINYFINYFTNYFTKSLCVNLQINMKSLRHRFIKFQYNADSDDIFAENVLSRIFEVAYYKPNISFLKLKMQI